MNVSLFALASSKVVKNKVLVLLLLYILVFPYSCVDYESLFQFLIVIPNTNMYTCM